MTKKVLSFSEVGGPRHNEDAFIVGPHPLDPKVTLCFMADGQGGQQGGGPAANLACRTAFESVAVRPPEQLADRSIWSDLLRVADEAVRRDAGAGLTTLVGLCVTGQCIVGVSCGDCAALLVTEGRSVELTGSQQKNPPVGSGSALPVTFEAALVAPWRLLVMTDGVWKYVGWQRLIEVAQRKCETQLIEELQQAARLPGSGRFQDDLTVVLLE